MPTTCETFFKVHKHPKKGTRVYNILGKHVNLKDVVEFANQQYALNKFALDPKITDVELKKIDCLRDQFFAFIDNIVTTFKELIQICPIWIQENPIVEMILGLILSIKETEFVKSIIDMRDKYLYLVYVNSLIQQRNRELSEIESNYLQQLKEIAVLLSPIHQSNVTKSKIEQVPQIIKEFLYENSNITAELAMKNRESELQKKDSNVLTKMVLEQEKQIKILKFLVETLRDQSAELYNSSIKKSDLSSTKNAELISAIEKEQIPFHLIPECFLDPITKTPFEAPLLAPNGITYDSQTLVNIAATNPQISLEKSIPNKAIVGAYQAWQFLANRLISSSVNQQSGNGEVFYSDTLCSTSMMDPYDASKRKENSTKIFVYLSKDEEFDSKIEYSDSDYQEKFLSSPIIKVDLASGSPCEIVNQIIFQNMFDFRAFGDRTKDLNTYACQFNFHCPSTVHAIKTALFGKVDFLMNHFGFRNQAGESPSSKEKEFHLLIQKTISMIFCQLAEFALYSKILSNSFSAKYAIVLLRPQSDYGSLQDYNEYINKKLEILCQDTDIFYQKNNVDIKKIYPKFFDHLSTTLFAHCQPIKAGDPFRNTQLNLVNLQPPLNIVLLFDFMFLHDPSENTDLPIVFTPVC